VTSQESQKNKLHRIIPLSPSTRQAAGNSISSYRYRLEEMRAESMSVNEHMKLQNMYFYTL